MVGIIGSVCSRMLDVVTVGETMVAFEAQDYGPLRENHAFKKWVGGAEDNVIIGLARLGFRCGWFSRLGDDEFGKEIFRVIRGEGVDVSRVIFDPKAPTGVFFVERHAEGDFKCYYYRNFSAATLIAPEDVNQDYIKQARIVYLGGIVPIISNSAREATEKIFQIATANEQTIVFDPNLRLKVCDIATSRSILIPMMQQSSYILPGEEELRLLMDCADLPSAIQKAQSLGIKNLIIKRGANGATLAAGHKEPTNVPAFRLNNPVSSMGAGDAFVAGFVAGLLKGQPLEECVRWGNAIGAFCLMGEGPYQTLPSPEELEAFLAGKADIIR